MSWIGLQPGLKLARFVRVQFTFTQAQSPLGGLLFDSRRVHGSAMSSVRWQ